MSGKVYQGVQHEDQNRPLELYEIHLLEKVADEGGAVRIPVISFKSMKPGDAKALKAMIDCFRQLEQWGYVLAEVDDARSEIRVSLQERAIQILEARGALKGQTKQ